MASSPDDDAAAALRARLESRVIDRGRFGLDVDETATATATAPKPKRLNVTCYGSSSSKTPERYLEEARLLGYILARRGHVCVNGAGAYGCMAAMNDGVHAGEGHVRGVIHEMFLVDNGYYDDVVDDVDDVDAKSTRTTRRMRPGSSHPVFENAVMLDRKEQNERSNRERRDDNDRIERGSEEEENDGKKQKPMREILVAGGPDLQERKKFLVADADALIVLPGGPGTWDELWEMACARHLNLHGLPIVCVNVDGYYEPFRAMLRRAWDDRLIHLPPDEIVRFADGAEDAVRFVEEEESSSATKDAASREDPGGKSSREENSWGSLRLPALLAVAFAAGAASGIAIAGSRGAAVGRR